MLSWLLDSKDVEGCNSHAVFIYTSQRQLNELDKVSIGSFPIVSLRIMGAGWCQHGIEQHILLFVPFEIVLLAVASARTASPPHLEWCWTGQPGLLDHIGSTSPLHWKAETLRRAQNLTLSHVAPFKKVA